MNILTFDMGTKNTAASVHVFANNKLSIVGTSMFPTISGLVDRDIGNHCHEFYQSVYRMCKHHSIDYVYAERFQFRGAGIAIIEPINVMLGLIMLAATRYGAGSRLITASTWKNNFNNNCCDLNAVYKNYGLTRVHSVKRDHELDASLIGVYTLCDVLGIKPFAGFDIATYMERFMECPSLTL